MWNALKLPRKLEITPTGGAWNLLVRRRSSIVLAVSALSIYALLFLVFYPTAGGLMGQAATLPVVLIAWFLGYRAGLIAALVIVPLNTLLLNVMGESGWGVWLKLPGAAFGTAMLVLIGAGVGWYRDVTDQLRVSDASKRLLLDTIPDVIFRFRCDGTVVDVGGKARDHQTLDFGRLKGRHLDQVFPNDIARDLLASAHAASEDGGPRMFESQLPATDEEGCPRDLEFRLVSAGDNEVQVMVRDVTDKKATESERGRLAAALESTGDAVLLADMSGRLTFTNRSAEQLFGTAPGGLDGRPVDEMLRWSDGQERGSVTLARIGEGWTGDAAAISATGEAVPVSVSTTPFNEDGRQGGFVAVLTDVSRYKEQEVALRRRSEETASLFTIAKLLARQGEFHEKASRVLEEIARASQADCVTLRLRDEGTRSLRLVADFEALTVDVVPERVPFDVGSSGKAFSERRTVVSNNYPAETWARSESIQNGINSIVAVPIRDGGAPIGVISVVSKKTDHFNPARVDLLNAIGEGMAALLEYARVQEAETLRSRELEALVSIAGILVQTTSLEEKAAKVMDVVVNVANVESATLRFVDDQGAGLQLVAAAGTGNRVSSPSEIVPYDSLTARAFAEGGPIVINDYASNPNANGNALRRGVKSSVLLPIKSNGRSLGVVTVASWETDYFKDDLVRVLAAVADGIGSLMDNARLAQEVSDELDQGRRRVEAFRTVAGTLDLADNPRETLQRLVESARELVAARCGALALWDKGGEIASWITAGEDEDETQHAALQLAEQSLASLVRDSKEPVRVGNMFGRLLYSNEVEDSVPVTNFLGIPLTLRDGRSGALYLTEKEGASDFSSDDERMLGLFAVQATVLLENLLLFSTESRERSTLAAVQESMTDGLIVLDRARNLLYRNKVISDIIKIPDRHVIGRPVQNILRLRGSALADPASTTIAALDLIDRSALGPATVEIAIERPVHRDYVLTAFPIPVDDAESLTGILVHDVTEERETSRRRDTFISVASHELRTPTSIITGFSELLLEDGVPESNRQEWMERIYRSGRKLREIVDQLLNLSRIHSGMLNVSVASVSVREAVDEALLSLGPLADDHQLIVDIQPEDQRMVTDRDKLAQVLSNLLTNATKYSPPGGNISVSARYREDKERVVMAIADQGIGIGLDDLANLFTPFYRVSRVETQNVRGSGLGLSIVKGLVELMDGEIWVDSKLDKGTTFYFTVPGPAQENNSTESQT